MNKVRKHIVGIGVRMLVVILIVASVSSIMAKETEPKSALTSASTKGSSSGGGDRSILDIYNAGGIWMHPILLCSIGAFACGGWSFWFLRKSLMLPSVAVATLQEHASTGNAHAMKNLCLSLPSPLGLALLGGLEQLEEKADRQAVEEQVAETLASEENRYQRWVNFLNVFAQLAPMLGLLGTVVGMIQSFDQLAHGRSEPSDLAGGIGVAMITTAGGLIVAIPSMFAYFCFRARLVALMDETHQVAGRVLAKLFSTRSVRAVEMES